MQVVLFPLVVENRKVPLSDESGEAVGGGHVAGRQRRERGRVHGIEVTDTGDLLAVSVNQTDHSRVRLAAQSLEELADRLVVFLVEDEVRSGHPNSLGAGSNI